MKQKEKRELKRKFNEFLVELVTQNGEALAEALGGEVEVHETAKGTTVMFGEVAIVADGVVKENFDLEDELMALEDRRKREAEALAKKLAKEKEKGE